MYPNRAIPGQNPLCEDTKRERIVEFGFHEQVTSTARTDVSPGERSSTTTADRLVLAVFALGDYNPYIRRLLQS
jgi:hypothetical protein